MSRQSVQRVKAVVVREIGKPPAVEEIEVDGPRYGEVTALDELITRTYSIDEAPQAFADLASGGEGRGVIIFGEK